jgi:thiamine biosynthesis protein ThiS
MEFFLNGQKKDGFAPSLTIADLLEQLSINPKSVVVERNLEIVSRNTMDEETIQNGDCIEIVRIVGGG